MRSVGKLLVIYLYLYLHLVISISRNPGQIIFHTMKSGTSTTTHLPGFSHIGQLNLALLIGQEPVLEWLVRLRGRGSIQYIEVDKQCYGDHIIKNWNHNNILHICQPYCVACVVVYFSGQADCFKDGPYSGGDCVTVKGSLHQNAVFSEQLFSGGLSMEDGSVHLFYSVKADTNSDVGLSLDLSSRNKGITSILIAEGVATFARKKQYRKYSSYVKADKAEPHAPDNQNWVLYKATVQSSAGYTLTGINIVCTLRTTGKINSETEEDGSSEADAYRSSPYHASLGHVSIRNTDENTQFPPAESWVTKGEYISWSKISNKSKLVSLKISWKQNTSHPASFMKYNVYVEKLTAESNAKASRSFLGVASVKAFYVSDVQVPDEATSLKFIIQACGHDGSCQELEDCPKFNLVPVDSDV